MYFIVFFLVVFFKYLISGDSFVFICNLINSFLEKYVFFLKVDFYS